MQRHLLVLALSIGASALAGSTALAQATPEVTLTRLECGTPQARRSTSTRASRTPTPIPAETAICLQLLPHQARRRLHDVGHGPGDQRRRRCARKSPLVDLLAQLKVTPEQVKYVGISHYHGDHIGQANALPESDAADRQGRLGCA